MPSPHCGLKTKLHFDEDFSAESSSAFVDDKSTSLQERIAIFKAHTEANKPKRDAELKEFENIIRRYETTAKIQSNKDELELAVDKIIIRKRGWANALASGMNGERTIPISSLTAIQLKPGGMITLGYILFSYAGSKPSMGGIWEATQDPDTVLFGKELNAQVADFKAKVEKIMRDSKHAASTNSSPVALTEELRKLVEFKQQGFCHRKNLTRQRKNC